VSLGRDTGSKLVDPLQSLRLREEFQGLYIHVPFCSSRCSYCDFATDLEAGSDRQDYLDGLCDEMENYAHLSLRIDTIYFGGGTPSLLKPSTIHRIIEKVRNTWRDSPIDEVTLESNPETLDPDSVKSFIAAGINRFSVGIQTFCENELRVLGRKHLSSQNHLALQTLQEQGVRFNTDLMVGIPLQTRASVDKNLQYLQGYEASHISVYMLSVEEGAPWFEAIKKEKLRPLEEKLAVELYRHCIDRLHSKNLCHYEVSAFARQGEECRHNLKYWKNWEFLGLGPSAASYLDCRRFQNQRTLKKWISQLKGQEPYENFAHISSKNAILDTIMLRFRLMEGLQASQLEEWEEHFPTLRIFHRLSKLQERGLIKKQAMRYRLTDQGLLFANEVFLEFLD
jgi:oxygen-independent coproporphyrinogen III oxidase